MARSSSELIDRFGKASPGAKAAIFVGIGVVLGGLYYYLFYSDLSEERHALVSQRKTLAGEERNLQDRKKDYAKLLQTKLEVEEELKKNAVRLPSSSELPAFFVHLQTQANAASVRTNDWARKSEIPVESYVKVPVEIEVEGDFYQLLQYFKLLSETPRIISVENLTIKRPSESHHGAEGALTARFLASTFRQADLPPAQIEDKKKPGAPAPPSQPSAAEPPKTGTKP